QHQAIALARSLLVDNGVVRAAAAAIGDRSGTRAATAAACTAFHAAAAILAAAPLIVAGVAVADPVCALVESLGAGPPITPIPFPAAQAGAAGGDVREDRPATVLAAGIQSHRGQQQCRERKAFHKSPP